MLGELIDDGLICEDDRVAVGVSGGADSMILLCALAEKQKRIPFFLEAVHVNHNLRGKESLDDADFVAKFCKKHKIECVVLSVDVKAKKDDEKLTLEESARNARFEAIFLEMKKNKLNKLFLAHHKNDQAETILMHLFRGSGLSGAVGLRENGVIFRPLLNLKKEEILRLAEDNNIPFVTDSSNSDNRFSRNFVRNVVIPQVQKVYPAVVENLFNFGEICREIEEFVKSQINLKLVDFKSNEVLVYDEALCEPSFIAFEYLKFALEKLGVFSDIEAKHLRLVLNLKNLQVGAEISLPHKIIARKHYFGIKFLRPTKKVKNEAEVPFVLGELKFGSIQIKTEFVLEDAVEYGGACQFLDYLKIPSNAVWRHRKLGDRFAKLGSGSKKLNDYFTDKKIDSTLRDEILLLASGSDILVVLGYDISDKVKLDSNSDKIIKISIS